MKTKVCAKYNLRRRDGVYRFNQSFKILLVLKICYQKKKYQELSCTKNHNYRKIQCNCLEIDAVKPIQEDQAFMGVEIINYLKLLSTTGGVVDELISLYFESKAPTLGEYYFYRLF